MDNHSKLVNGFFNSIKLFAFVFFLLLPLFAEYGIEFHAVTFSCSDKFIEDNLFFAYLIGVVGAGLSALVSSFLITGILWAIDTNMSKVFQYFPRRFLY
jgi:hypothetical protein